MSTNPLPGIIRVGPFDMRILPWAHQEAATRGKFAEFTVPEFAIRIDVSMPPAKIVDSLIHELNHAIFWVYGIEDRDKEERLVGTLATAWTAIFRDSPEVLDCISKLLHGQERDGEE